MSDWQAAQKQAYDDSLRAQSGEGDWVTLPIGEFENLHESNRLLRQKIAQLQEQVQGYYEFSVARAAEARRWKTVVAATHGDAGGHRNPYLECDHALCVAARLG